MIDPDYYASEYFVSKISKKCEDFLPPQDDCDGNDDIKMGFPGITFDPNDDVVNCLLAAPPNVYDELAPNKNLKFISSVSLDYQQPVLVLYSGKGTAKDRRNSARWRKQRAVSTRRATRPTTQNAHVRAKTAGEAWVDNCIEWT